MAFVRVRDLMLFLCATVLVGVSAYAHASKNMETTVRVGIFNSQKMAQKFFETLPPQYQSTIKTDQLWLNAYQSVSGLTEFYLDISSMGQDTASNLCSYLHEQDTQCVISQRSLLMASPSAYQAPAPITNFSQTGATPHLLQARGMRIAPPPFAAKQHPENLIARQTIDRHQALVETMTDHQQEFALYPQTTDTPKSRAAKAAYNAARNQFTDALQRISNSANAGQGNEAAQQEAIALGMEAFKNAGSAYLSSYLDRAGDKAAALSSDAGTGETFVHHVKKNLVSSAQSTVESLVSDLVSSAAYGENNTGDVLRNKTDTFMLSGASGLIEAGLSAARRSDLYALRHLELEYNLNNFEDSYFSVLATQPIYQTDDLRHSIFFQGGGIINEKSVDIDDDTARHTLNAGAAYRYLTVDEKYLLGGNIFFDHQWPYNHSRMSVGLDAKAQDVSLAANYYIPLSGFKDSRTDENGVEYQERAMRGYDVELGYNLPFMRDMSVFGKGYQYFSTVDNEEDIRGLELSAEYNIRDNFTLKGSVVEENGGRDGVEVALQYRIPLYDEDEPNLALADLEPAAGEQSMRGKIFDKVRRENRIRLEERQKASPVSATVLSAVFNAASIGLPFDVGGALTGAGTDLPFDTAITIPNGDFGIINFSNGAIANISASGAGDVILEFNETTLTVTATNGGFVQFISAGGGISTINVPGGVVNLLGTDVDITDDGVTTTIQVRAGQIGVVPTVGVDLETGNQADVVSLTIATGATVLLANPALETRQEAAYTNLDLINPSPPATATSAPFINVAPQLITGPQFVGNNADLRLTFTQPVTVGGAPFINGLIDATPRTFAYNAGASTPTQLVFRHVYLAGDVGSAAITIQNLDLNGGSIVGTSNALNAITAFTDTIVPITDQTAPMLIGSTPVDNEPAFGAASDIVLNFDENIQANIGNITITDTTDGSSTLVIPIGDAQISIAGSMLTINPAGVLDLSTDYDITIPPNVIQDLAGNAFAGITTGNLNFTTSNDVTPPMLTGSAPADNAIGVARNSTITLTFDEDVMLSGTINLVDTDDASGNVAYTSASPEVNVTNNVITITPASNLEYAENYEVRWVAGAIEDLSGNDAAASNATDLNFKTIDLEQTLALTLAITGPDGDIDENNIQGSGIALARTSSVVMAADITITAAPNGVIYEHGGTGIGAWVGFNSGDGVFRARGGDGDPIPDTLAASAETPIGTFTPGSYTLTWEFNVALGRVRVWLDENLIASDTATANMFESNTWCGTDNGGYGQISGTNASIATGEITTSYNGMLLSDLRYYAAQTIP